MANYGFRINDALNPQYQAWFLEALPNTEIDENGNQVYTDVQWINKYLVNGFLTQCRNGERKLYSAQQQSTVSEGDIT